MTDTLLSLIPNACDDIVNTNTACFISVLDHREEELGENAIDFYWLIKLSKQCESVITTCFPYGGCIVGIDLTYSPLIPALVLGILNMKNTFCFLEKVNKECAFNLPCLAVVITNNVNNLPSDFSYEELLIGFLCEKLYFGFRRKDAALRHFDGLSKRNIAYVAFTSGTTGDKKPVFVSHQSLIPNVRDFSQLWNITKSDIIAVMSPFTFDPSMVDLFCGLVSSACLCIIRPEHKLNGVNLALSLLHSGVSVVQMTPSLFSSLSVDDLELLLHSPYSKLRIIALGGEKFPYSKLQLIPVVICRWLLHPERRNKMFNLYGVTEVSCWSAFYEINYDSVCNLLNDAVPDIGHALSGSILLPVIQTTSRSSSNIREMAISTECRHCFLGSELYGCRTVSERHVHRTGDLITFACDGFFNIVSRIDNFTKRFGVKISCSKLECTILKLLKNEAYRIVSLPCVVKGKNIMKVCIFLNSEDDPHHSAEDIKIFVCKELGAIYVPECIHFTRSPVPLTRHGKICKATIAKYFDDYSVGDDRSPAALNNLINIIQDLWLEITGAAPTTNCRFLESGGDSVGVIRFCEKIRCLLPKSSAILTKLPNLLLTKSYSDVVAYVKSDRTFFDEDVSMQLFKSEKVAESSSPINFTAVFRANNMYGLHTIDTGNTENISCKLSIAWRVYMEKCIDASPVVKVSNDDAVVFICSHSGLVRCLDAYSGAARWEFRASNRIEASVALSACGDYIIFGSYDKHIYVLNANSGHLHFKTPTGDIVKSTPSVDYTSGLSNNSAFVGCHDGCLYVIKPKQGEVFGKVNCNSGGILSSPLVCDNTRVVIVCTLQGKMICLENGSFISRWRLDLGSPVFSTPIELKLFNKCDKTFIICATVTGNVNAVSIETGQVAWKVQLAVGNIFAPLISSDTSVIVATHDSSAKTGSLCCYRNDGNLLWNTAIPNPITGAPFILNDNIFIIDTKGHVYILKKCDGNFIVNTTTTSGSTSIFSIPGEVFSSPVIFNNHLYVGCRDDYFYNINITS